MLTVLNKEITSKIQHSKIVLILILRMDKNKIAHLAKQITTKEDLLDLLNLVKLDEMDRLGFRDKFYPFTMRHLQYYCNPNHVFHRYRDFKIKKKSGGYRQITAPRNKSFMLILKYVNEIFKSIYIPSNDVMGFAEGRSVLDNASKHLGMNYVFNVDLKDFFPSIEQARVWKRLQLPPMSFSPTVANVLAGLCSMRGEKKEDGGYRYVLPQGAPTSPILTNMICDTLDRRLNGLAKRFMLNYSRYADDITFSSMHNVYHVDGDFRKELYRIIEGQGFIINESKIRLQKIGSRQEVTGLIVSDKVNVGQKYVRDIRNILYIWDRYGYTSAMAKFFPVYNTAKGHVKSGKPDLQNVIKGKLMYLKMVKGDTDSVYVRLNTKFLELVHRDFDASKTNSYGITYIESMPLLKFETDKNANITIHHNDNDKRYATFKLGNKSQVASINKGVTQDDEQQKEKLAISYCRDSKGKMFWLIHLLDKATKFNPKPVNIDELNNELDLLLIM